MVDLVPDESPTRDQVRDATFHLLSGILNTAERQHLGTPQALAELCLTVILQRPPAPGSG